MRAGTLTSRMLVVLCAAVMPGAALAHARLSYPPPRSPSAGIKGPAPCGTFPRTAPTVFEPGETITVTWEETISHPGHYRLAFSPAGDLGFDQNVLADNLPNPAGLQNGSRAVTLPDVPCEDCSLQLIQVMTDTNPPSNYYSCADIALRAPDAGVGVEDAGQVEPDAGAPDAGPPDAGAPIADAGGGTDAGGTEPGTDAGTAATQKDGEPIALGPVVGGCSAGGMGGGAIAVFGVFLFAFARRRRQRSSR